MVAKFQILICTWKKLKFSQKGWLDQASLYGLKKKKIMTIRSLYFFQPKVFQPTFLEMTLKVRQNYFLKFKYSEKATKIWPIFHFLFDIT